MNFYTSVSRALTPNKTSGSMDTLRHKLVMPTALILACLLVEPPHGSVAIFGLATPSTPTSKGKVQANGITIAYESFGPADRETVLLIMGTGGQLTAWPVELCEELVKRGYRVVRYDNRDVGLSTRFEAAGIPDFAAVVAAAQAGKAAPLPYTLYDMAKDAVGLLESLGIGKAHMVGASMDGMIAQIVATDHPDRTLSLTSIMATSGKPGLPIIAKPEVVAKIPPPPAVDQTGAQHTDLTTRVPRLGRIVA